MTFSIVKHIWGSEADVEIEKLLHQVFVGEGYTNPGNAGKAFASEKLKGRGTAFTAIETTAGCVAGVVFYVRGGGEASQIAGAREAEIHLLTVHLRYRGARLGERLVEACLDQAERDGIARMVLSTQDSMINAHRLYAHMGFARNEARDWPRPAGGTYRVYEKALA